MAVAQVYKRLCGFGSDNSYVNRHLAVVGSTSVYDAETCYRKLGVTVEAKATSWLPKEYTPNTSSNTSSTVKTVTNSLPSPAKEVSMNTLVKQDNVTDDKSQTLANQLFSGLSGSGGISFGADQSKALIPIVLAVAVAFAVMFFGGVFKFGKRR